MRADRTFVVLVVAGVSLATCFGGNTCYWTGKGANNSWATPGNWLNGSVPGRLGSPTAAIEDVQGDFGDTAVFSAVEDGARTQIDLSGLRSIGHIVIRGADAPSFTFGTAAGGSEGTSVHNLRLEQNASFTIEAEVVNAPTFYAGVRIVDGFDVSGVVTNTFRNDSSVVFDLPAFAFPRTAAGANLVEDRVALDFKGSGDIRLNGEFYYNFETLILNQTGKLIVNTKFSGRNYGQYGPYALVAGPDTTLARIQINENCELRARPQYANYVKVVSSSLEITGDGVFATYSAGNTTGITVGSGRTLAISCKYVSHSYDSSTNPPVYPAGQGGFETSTGDGTVKLLNSANEIGGTVTAKYGLKLEVPEIGAAGVQSCVGTSNIVMFSNGVLKYTGSGETTGKEVAIATSTAGNGKLLQAGTGLWKLSDVKLKSANNGTFQLNNAAGAADAEISCGLSNSAQGGVLSIEKRDSGRWIFSGVNTYTGSTTIYGGTLRYEASQTVTNLSIQGDSTLEVASGVTLVVSPVSRSSGTTLNIVSEDTTAKVKMPSLAGTSPSYITWNSLPVDVDAEGNVAVSAASAEIAARGEQVPSREGRVAIVYPGTSGNDTLASDSVSVGSLEQLSQTPAVVEIGAGRTLTAGKVLIASGGADLTIGTQGDLGNLDSSGALVLQNKSTAGTLSINAPFGGTASRVLVRGPGETVLSATNTLPETRVGDIASATGRLTVVGTKLTIGEKPLFVGYYNNGNDWSGDLTSCAVMTVTNATIENESFDTTYSYCSNRVLGVARNARGTLVVESGAVISNKLQVGFLTDKITGSGHGALYLRGGSITAIGRNDSSSYKGSGIGMGGHGFMEFTGGSFTAAGLFYVGGYGSGVWYQRGGTTAIFGPRVGQTTAAALNIQGANGRAGVVYLTDGAKFIHRSGSLYVGASYAAAKDGTPYSHIVVDGEGTLFENSGASIYVNHNVNNTNLLANIDVLNGGTLYVMAIVQKQPGPYLSVAFDGGVLKCSANVTVFGAGNEELPDLITVYKGGVTVDTTDRTVTSGAPFTAPEGKGICGFEATYPLARSNVAPFVEIEGDGEGAAAIALYDSGRQCVTGLVVTAPGVNYTTATAKLCLGTAKRGEGGVVATVPCLLADNVATGSFTKTGSGTFKISKPCTWGGDTIVKQGTLTANCFNAIPANTRVVLCGGTLNLNGMAATISRVTYRPGAGSIVDAGGATLPSDGFDMEISLEEILSGNPIVFPGSMDISGKTLRVTGDFAGLDSAARRGYTVVSSSGGSLTGTPVIDAPGLPQEWRFEVRGNSVKLLYSYGSLLILR